MKSSKLQLKWQDTQVSILKLPVPWMPMEKWLEHGLTPTEVTPQIANFMSLYITLDRAGRKPFSIKSNFARRGAFPVAICASEGLITTNIGDDVYGSSWTLTEVGKETKGELNELLQEIFATACGRDHTAH